MREFTFQRVAAPEDAAMVVTASPSAMFLAGGTTLVDLMKIDVLTPDIVVEVRHLGMSTIEVSDESIAVGAAVTNSQLAWHPVVRDRYPVLAEAILAGAALRGEDHQHSTALARESVLQKSGRLTPHWRCRCNRRVGPRQRCGTVPGRPAAALPRLDLQIR